MRAARPGRFLAASVVLVMVGGPAAGCAGERHRPAEGEDVPPVCVEETSECVGGEHRRCTVEDGFLTLTTEDCEAAGWTCVADLGCRTCVPDTLGCQAGHPARCLPDGSDWERTETCALDDGLACESGACIDLCTQAESTNQYAGCLLYAADLDTGVDGPLDPSAQQYAVAIANPSELEATVTVERNDAPLGEAPTVAEVRTDTVPPRGLVVLDLPRREVDGSSPSGSNDGTHSAVTSNAYRIRSDFPVIAYQFNPLAPSGVFSSDASLLIPTAAWGEDYDVLAWPQTIGPNETGYDVSSKANTLTILGSTADTTVTVTLGPHAKLVLGDGASIPESGPGQVLSFEVGPFDVINLETGWWGSDFSGSRIEASDPVGVFVGSEGVDVPYFESPGLRSPAADHIEEMLPPTRTLGQRFFVPSPVSRTEAIAATIPSPPFVPGPERGWVRVMAVEDDTTVLTSLSTEPTTLQAREWVTWSHEVPFQIEADAPLLVLAFLGGQASTGLPHGAPGGDPAAMLVPPVDQWRHDYVVLSPPHYAFDFLTLVAPPEADVRVDSVPVDEACRPVGDELGGFRQWQCQLSFPIIERTGEDYLVEHGSQGDGIHRVVADQPVAVWATGFDRYISYAYPGGMDLHPLF